MSNVPETLIETIHTWHDQGKKVVLATGVFDLLHIEHIRFLNEAKRQGNILIVGVETDNRVKRIKGNDRPINPEAIRVEQVAALKAVNVSFLLPTTFDTQRAWEQLIAGLQPDVYAVSEHASHLANKQAICAKYHAKLVIVRSFNPTYSSSKILERIHELELE